MKEYWIKDVSNKSEIAYDDFEEGEIFNLHWPSGAGKRSETIPFGDFVILKQRQKITHFVMMIDSSTSNDPNRSDYELYREVYCIKRYPDLDVIDVFGKNNADRGLGSKLHLNDYSLSTTDFLTALGLSLSDLLQISEFSDYSISDFPEGRIKYRQHRIVERNSSLVKNKKELTLKDKGDLICEVCGLSFHKIYGETGEGFIEAHHLVPISHNSGIKNTTINDLILVCSNCHRMIHRINPYCYKLSEIKERFKMD